MDIQLKRVSRTSKNIGENCLFCTKDTNGCYIFMYVTKTFLPIGRLCLDCADKLTILYTGRFPLFSFESGVTLHNAIPDYIPTKQQCRKYIKEKMSREYEQ